MIFLGAIQLDFLTINDVSSLQYSTYTIFVVFTPFAYLNYRMELDVIYVYVVHAIGVDECRQPEQSASVCIAYPW